MIKCTRLIPLLILTSCVHKPLLPPSPLGFAPNMLGQSLSGRAAVHSASLPMAELAATSNLTATISLAGSNVTVQWSGPAPYQLESQSSINGPWNPAGDVTMRQSVTLAADNNRFYRIRGAINLLTISHTNLTTLTWSPPQLDMSDSLTKTVIQRRATDPGPSPLPSEDAGWDSEPPYGNQALTTITPTYANRAPGDNATDTQAPNPTFWYREREVTANGVFIPVGPQVISGLQPGGFLWSNSATNATTIVTAQDTVLDSQGNVFTGGFFTLQTIWGGITLTANRAFGSFVVKHNNVGQVLYAHQYSGSSVSEKAFSVACDSSDNLITSGTFGGTPVDFEGTTLTALGTQPHTDGYLLKMSAANPPVLAWIKQLGSTADDYGYKVLVDPNNNVIVAFSLNAATTIYGTPLNAGYCLAKFAANGTLTWVVNLPTGDLFNTNIGGMSVDPVSGAIYIATSVSAPQAGYAPKMYIGKFSSVGAVIWEQIYGNFNTGDAEFFTTVAVGSDGALYATGGCSTGSDFNSLVLDYFQNQSVSETGTRIFMCRLNPVDGTVLWGRTLNISGNSAYKPSAESGLSVAVGDGGNVFWGGTCAAPIGFHLGEILIVNGHSMYLCSTDSSGSIRWGFRSSGSASAYGLYARNGKLAVCGVATPTTMQFDFKDPSHGTTTAGAPGYVYPFVAVFNQ